MNAFITDIAAFLPNKPVNNNEMEQVLGLVDNLPSRTKKIILRNNGIKERYYACDPATGKSTHTNAELTACAVRDLCHNNLKLTNIDLLSCGTSTPDQLLPGHGIMVHGELTESSPLEVVTTSGICLAGVSSLKYVCMAVASGCCQNGIATSSELVSSFLKGEMFTGSNQETHDIEKQPHLGFQADFLRWMLSDGSAACLVETNPRTDRLNLKVEWLDILSQAHRLEPCMYAGCIKQEDGTLRGWRECLNLTKNLQTEVFPIKQDAKLLNNTILDVIIDETLVPLVKKHQLSANDITWFLPHYSSEYFRDKVFNRLEQLNFTIPYERWFTNLTTKGNTGSASIFIMLEELLHSGKLQKNDTILCMVPESGRFSCGYMYFTVV
jgi:3-oxoacyl-[acyl-carrier-protein] synthase-3